MRRLAFPLACGLLALLAAPRAGSAAASAAPSSAATARYKSSGGGKAPRSPAIRPAPRTLRPQQSYERSLARATRALVHGQQRGLVQLDPSLPTVVIPDIHARTEYLSRVLERTDRKSGKTYGQLLRDKKLQVVVVGDGMHAEGRAAERWAEAERNPQGPAMRAELAESLGTMKQIMDFKAAHPDHFHYLKGNHDNIRNRRVAGDWPVVKYTEAGESKLVRDAVVERFGAPFLARYAAFERALPIMAVGGNFAVSHSGPATPMKPGEIRRRGGKAVENFTWTDLTRDSAKQARVVDRQLQLLGREGGYYLAGHRQTGPRGYRKQGRFYQVNAEDKRYFLVLDPSRALDPARDLHQLRSR